MRLLLLTEYFPDSAETNITGGVESRVFNVAKCLAKKHDVTIVTSWRKELKREDSFEGFKVIRTGPHHNYSNQGKYLSRLKFAYAVERTGIKLNFDVIDAQNFTTYFPAFRISRQKKIPVVATYHETWIGEWVKIKGIGGFPYEIAERFLIKLKFDKFISVSEFTKKRLEKFGIKNTIVIPNGVDLINIDSVHADKDKFPTLCFVGRLIPSKKVDILLMAANKVQQHFPNLKLKIVGQGSELSRLKQLSNDLQLNVEFKGYIENNKEVLEIIKSCSILCQPSIVEGFGIILIEAAALGVPYVCSDIDPFIEVTKNGRGGLIFKKNNPEDMADKIINLLKDKFLYDEKTIECKQFAKSYDWQTISKKIESVYQDIKR